MLGAANTSDCQKRCTDVDKLIYAAESTEQSIVNIASHRHLHVIQMRERKKKTETINRGKTNSLNGNLLHTEIKNKEYVA